MKKQRLDTLILGRGLADSLSHAQALILSGSVLVDDMPSDKVGALIPVDARIRVRGDQSAFVGRGGDKIEFAFGEFAIQISGRVALDVGASTGGFTDCMLQRGAELVYAVDVGYNQLAHSLRIDPRVVVMEQTHAAQLRPELFPRPPSLATVDVSFIGVAQILPAVAAVLAPSSDLVVLVKPQFELSRELIDKGGVVHNEADQLRAVDQVADAARTLRMNVRGRCKSPLKGQKSGNQEYFLHLETLPAA